MRVLLNGLYKGGIGKTTQTVIMVNLLAERGYKVLVVDCDSQMNCTTFLTSRPKNDKEFTEKNILKAIEDGSIGANIVSFNENIDIVPGSVGINQFESIMNQKREQNRISYFRRLLEPIRKTEQYDFIIMDMSPSSSPLNTSVMAAATDHVILTQSEYMSMQMVPDYIKDIQSIQRQYGLKSNFLGISCVMLDARGKTDKQIIKTLRDSFKGLMFNTVIKRKARIKEYSVHGFPRRKSRNDVSALRDYNDLLDEVLKRLNLPVSKGETING